ncbi:MAG: ribosomal L7Ae/L30e/S12e/Gadd45 family protein [Nanoarchaeota archaeon]|nr:ribosomal L7Ae/L30e/S12e/Gadd45 family protein [Nanoarchaeota archaeon]
MAEEEKKYTVIEEIKKFIKDNSLILGTERTVKELRKGNLSKVFISKNAPQEVIDDVHKYAGLQNIPIVVLDKTNDELGIVCKKPFSISFMGVIKS